ncbi:MAG: GNAT family N-acetyltransferase [Candidatus Eisenbacteria bacterium]|nr:GNAT family N-acetyltransferase [Candidatus Eisenbacteria bacterium]
MPASSDNRGPRFIMGRGLTLRRLERVDLPHIRRWLGDSELRGEIGATAPMSEGDAEEWFERTRSDPRRVWYVIVLDEGDRVIGEAGLLRISPEWRTTDMTVIIGDPAERGKGYGSEVGRLILDLAFNYYGLHRVAIGVVGFNEAALRFWKRLGFREEGVQRDGYFHGGRFHDFVMMSILEAEWADSAREES